MFCVCGAFFTSSVVRLNCSEVFECNEKRHGNINIWLLFILKLAMGNATPHVIRCLLHHLSRECASCALFHLVLSPWCGNVLGSLQMGMEDYCVRAWGEST